MIFFTHPLFTSSFSFSSDGGVAKTDSPTVNRWTIGTSKLIFCRLPLIAGGEGVCCTVRISGGFRVTVAHDYKAVGFLIFFFAFYNKARSGRR